MRFRIFILLPFLIFSCKDDDVEKTSRVKVNMEYSFGEESFEPDSVRYKILSGDSISITRMEYYISNLEFHSEGGWTSSDKYVYMNALDPKSFDLAVPIGAYDSVRLILGLTKEKNKTYALKPLPENVKMAWPDVMGGGYHFLKLEGHFLNEKSEYLGYALHMGTNSSQRTYVIPLKIDLIDDQHILGMSMDLSSWYNSPYKFNFNTGYNYTMGIDTLMAHLANNGIGSIKIKNFK